MFGPSLKLFQWRGIRVELTLLGGILVGFFLFTADTMIAPPSLLVLAALGVGAIFSLLIHELAHAAAGLATGSQPVEIKLDLPAGQTRFKARPVSWLKELGLALAGPLASLLIGWLCRQGSLVIINQPQSGGINEVGYLLHYLAGLNLFVAVVNLLPLYPFDGGQVTYRLLLGITHSSRLASALLLLSGWAITADLVFDLTHTFGQVYTGGVFSVIVAVIVPVSTFNLVAQTAFRFKPPEVASAEEQARLEDLSQKEAALLREAQAACDRGQVFLEEGKMGEALAAFNQGLILAPGDKLLLEKRARAFAALGQHLEALVDYSRLIHKEPANPAHYQARAALFEKLGQNHSARRDFNRANRLFRASTKKDPGANFNRAGNGLAGIVEVREPQDRFETIEIEPGSGNGQ